MTCHEQRHRWVSLVIAMWALVAVSAAQVPVRDTVVTPTFGASVVSGTVVNDAIPAQPVRRAIVTLSGAGLVPTRSAITDDEGRFTLERLPAGRFHLSAARSGFITSGYGAKRPGRPGTAIAVGAGVRVDDLRVRIWRGAAVAGVVRDEFGVPAPGIPVFAVPARLTSGVAPTLSNDGATTDDRGQFRIFGLEPGVYAVAARPAGGVGASMTARTEAETDAVFARLRSRAPSAGAVADPPASGPFTYAPVYYPGTANVSSATPITLAAGQVVEGLDFPLERVATAVVEGVVIRPDGTPASGAQVQLALVEPPGRFPSDEPVFLDTQSGPDGRFRISSVTPGDYRLIARTPATPPTPGPDTGRFFVSTGPSVWATADVRMVGSDVTGLVLPLAPGRSITGRLVFKGSADAPTSSTPLYARLTPVTGISRSSVIRTLASGWSALIKPDGSFVLEGVAPGRFRFSLTGPALTNSTWVPQSALVGDVDVFDGLVDTTSLPDGELVVTYTDVSSGLSGLLQTSDGSPFSDVFVIAYSTNTSHWGPHARRVRAVRPGVDGRYEMTGLPPGEYYLGAVTDVDEDEWHDPAFLTDLIASSLTLTIKDGEQKTQNLRIGTVGN
jgi:hypothetical protein